jgi:hypothetical protein
MYNRENNEYIEDGYEYAGEDIYDGVNINTINCKYIMKSVGAVSCDCSDFPKMCAICKHNKYERTPIKPLYAMKSHYKYFGDK